MSGIFRVKRTPGDFFQAYKPAFQNCNLSFAARGLLAYLCTKPDDWEVRNYDLVKASPGGKAALQTILKELREVGHIRRIARKKPNGDFAGWDTEVYENPKDNPDFVTDNPIFGKTENRNDQEVDSPETGKRKELRMTPTKNESTKNDNMSPSENLCQYFSSYTDKWPKGLIDQQEWDDDCMEILNKVGGDENLAKNLIIQAINTLDELEYQYKTPASLLDTIDIILKKRDKENGNGQNGNQPNIILPATANSDGSYNF